MKEICKEYKTGSEDWNDLMFCGQRTKWLYNDKREKDQIDVDQERGIDDLAEVIYDNKLDPDLACDADLHHQFRSGVGSVYWLQSRTQYQACYQFSRCASALAAPTTKDLEKLNKLIRQIRTDGVTLKYWPLPGFCLRLIGYPDASYRNNSDRSSQRVAVFVATMRHKDLTDAWGQSGRV